MICMINMKKVIVGYELTAKSAKNREKVWGMVYGGAGVPPA